VTNDTVKHFAVAVVDMVDVRELAEIEDSQERNAQFVNMKTHPLKVYGLVLTNSGLRTRVIGYLIAFFLFIVRYLAGKFFNS
jgi:hypothetical protein